MPSSKFLPVTVAFFAFLGGTSYLFSSRSNGGLDDALSVAMAYLPTYGAALGVALVCAYLGSLLRKRANRDKAFANIALVVFLAVAMLLILKGDEVKQQGRVLLDQGIQRVIGLLSGEPSTAPSTSRPAPAAPTASERPAPPPASRPAPSPPAPSSSAPPSRPAASGGTDFTRWAADLNRQLPRRADDYSRLTHAEYVAANKTMKLEYSVDNFDAMEVDEDEFVAGMTGNIRSEYCKGAFFREMRTQGVGIRVSYRYGQGGVIGEPIWASAKSC
ncbi:hypothetical protein [Halotalea alkalilenta]|uniref:Uncharacterized protein n=1 Tax=Halotalea alkalilenta TaxID=376489 RepID=A0A172YDK0_9GAMM|nr:hypothetical protein [Halotalea alkalilenta]ANF57341.1 hypothetical protein A5892_07590 [Halotalea alkalilenta]